MHSSFSPSLSLPVWRAFTTHHCGFWKGLLCNTFKVSVLMTTCVFNFKMLTRNSISLLWLQKYYAVSQVHYLCLCILVRTLQPLHCSWWCKHWCGWTADHVGQMYQCRPVLYRSRLHPVHPRYPGETGGGLQDSHQKILWRGTYMYNHDKHNTHHIQIYTYLQLHIHV